MSSGFEFPLLQPGMHGFSPCPNLEPVDSPMPDRNFAISWFADNDSISAQQALLEEIACAIRRAGPGFLVDDKGECKVPRQVNASQFQRVGGIEKRGDLCFRIGCADTVEPPVFDLCA